MKNIFLDTNVIIDFVIDRFPFSKHAQKLFVLEEKKKIFLFASSHSIATTHYFGKKVMPEKEIRAILKDLLISLRIIPLTHEMMIRAILSRHKDFEDGMQIVCAQSEKKIDCIVTRNIRDFTTAEIPVYTPDKLIELLNESD